MDSLGSLRRALSRVSRSGVDASANRRSAKPIILGNRLSISAACLCLPCAVAFHLTGQRALAGLTPLLLLCYLGVPVLSRFGFTWIARIWYVTVSNFSLLGFSLYLGADAGIHLLLFPIGWSSLALFSWDERKSMAYGPLLNIACLLAFEAVGSRQGGLNPFPAPIEKTMHLSFLIAAQIIQGLAALYFFLDNHRIEQNLANAAAAAEASDRAKSQFLANMSHEIRTPLNGILGISSLMMKYGSGRDSRKGIADIRNSAQDLLAIVNEILDLSRIESGKLKLERIPFDLRKSMDSVLGSFSLDAGKKDIALGLDMGSGVPDHLFGDPARLKQILLNLVGNALKFTQAGSVTLRVRASGADERGDSATARSETLTFEVIDTGIGIPEGARDRIFRSFSQAHGSIPHKYGGTGLGLFICKQFVEAMGGEIGYLSQEGKGTTFHFTLPFEVVEDDLPRPARDPAMPRQSVQQAAVAAGSQDVRILIVEDHPINTKVLRGILESYGFPADHVTNGKEALEAFDERGYDLVFMDCHMPVMDGFECTRRLREKRGRGTRIVGVTADAMAGSRQKCLTAGMDDVLTKPLDDGDVYRILKGLTSDRTLEAVGTESRAPEPSLIDRSQVRNMAKKLRSGFITDTLGEIRQETIRLIAEMRIVPWSEDAPCTHGALHELKGICLTLGLIRMAELCRRLETEASTGGSATWSSLLAELEKSLEPSLEELLKAAKAIHPPEGPLVHPGS